MKQIIILLALIFAINVSFGEAVQPKAQQVTPQKVKIQKIEKNLSTQALIKKISPKKSTVTIGNYAMIGILLVVLGALLFIPTLVQIIAATLIIMGVVLFVLDLIGMI